MHWFLYVPTAILIFNTKVPNCKHQVDIPTYIPKVTASWAKLATCRLINTPGGERPACHPLTQLISPPPSVRLPAPFDAAPPNSLKCTQGRPRHPEGICLGNCERFPVNTAKDLENRDGRRQWQLLSCPKEAKCTRVKAMVLKTRALLWRVFPSKNTVADTQNSNNNNTQNTWVSWK